MDDIVVANEVLHSLDRGRRRDGSIHQLRVLDANPSRERTRVGTSVRNPRVRGSQVVPEDHQEAHETR